MTLTHLGKLKKDVNMIEILPSLSLSIPPPPVTPGILATAFPMLLTSISLRSPSYTILPLAQKNS